MKEIPESVRWWVGAKLPPTAFSPPEGENLTASQKVGNEAKKWLIHPSKRHLARLYRQALEANGCEFIGITGSAGKTTTKEMTAAVLRQKYKTRWSKANIDPVHNIPHTLLTSPFTTQRMVLEMGIEYPGEMEYYLWLVTPRVGAVLNISPVHALYLKSVPEIVKEKGRLVQALGRGDTAVLNYDDTRVRGLADRTKARVIFFGTSKKADVRAQNPNITQKLKTSFDLILPDGQTQIELNMLGEHFIQPALAASAVGYVNGIPAHQIKLALETVQPQPHRMVPIKGPNGSLIIDDSYNSNPIAARAALKTIGEIDRPQKILVLGDMLELGQYEHQEHRNLGKLISESCATLLIGVGDASQTMTNEAAKHMPKEKVSWFHSVADPQLREAIYSRLDNRTVVLIKGSRSLRLDTLVDEIVPS